MKKIMVLLLAAAMMFSLGACIQRANEGEETGIYNAGEVHGQENPTRETDAAEATAAPPAEVPAVSEPEPQNLPAGEETVVCPSCGQSVGEGMLFCPSCGTPLSESEAVPAEAAGAAPASNMPAVTGTAGTGNLVYSFGGGEGIVVLEDAYLSVRLMSFFEEEVNWSSGRAIEKCVEFKIRNVSDREYILNFENAYIGDEGVRVIMKTGNTGPVPGKSNTYTYTIQRASGSDGKPLDSLDELYALEGSFSLHIYNADKSAITGNHKAALKLQNIFDGSAAPASSAAAAPVQDLKQEIESALQGVWMLGTDNTFTFRSGSVSISGGGGLLNGSYSINTDDSTIDATLQTSDGAVVIHLPYVYASGVLSLYNNRNVQLTKQ